MPPTLAIAENCPRFSWSAAKERAAQLLAEDELTIGEIALELGVSRPTLYELMEKLGINRE